jgi:hypothetical protein
MTPEGLTTPTTVAGWLRLRLRNGEGLTAPYARRWEAGGCTPTHSLWEWPSDRLHTLGSRLLSLGHPVFGIADGVVVDCRARRSSSPPTEATPEMAHRTRIA